VLATKAGNPGGKGPNDRGLGRRWLMQACENSLKRLDIDVIDIYYLHLEDPTTQLEETVSAIGTLMAEGMIHHFGVSNFRSWRIAEIVRLCDQMGIDRPIVSQPYYNAMNRQPEVEQLGVCAHYGMGVVPYSPLARGVLTGKYTPEAEPPADSRAAAKDVRMMETEWRPESLEIAQKIKTYAEGRGTTPGRLAFAWVLNNRIVSSVLAGPRTMDQWTDYVAGLGFEFTAEDEAFMNEMVPAGHPSTYGYTDPRYPLEGRPTWTGA
jgi:aryl-alcohol dehydrogenase-like predicted oxidoreductase